jgi:hypothetical protein
MDEEKRAACVEGKMREGGRWVTGDDCGTVVSRAHVEAANPAQT